MTREEFRKAVFERDHFTCVVCLEPAVDAHHLIERRLWGDGGYYLDNGVSLCAFHHLLAEQTLVTPWELREMAGIEKEILPDCLEDDHVYDKWGNIITPEGTRMRGPLFYDESVQKVLAPVLSQFLTYVKYPRTPHLPWSKGSTLDDMILRAAPFKPEDLVVVTEKLDGENTTMYRDYIHARSLENVYHSTRSWVKNFWATNVAYQIPSYMRIVGENMYGTHSIKYENLKSFFYGISIWEDERCLSYLETLENFEILGITPAPVLARGKFFDMIEFFENWKDNDQREGYVVRLESEFTLNNFSKSIAKYVRPDHVAGRAHWLVGKVDTNAIS